MGSEVNPNKDPADRITAAIGEAITAGEMATDGTVTGMPGAWVLVGSWHDQDGEDRSIFLSPPDQPLVMTLGLLESGQTVHREMMRRWVLGYLDDQ